MQVRIDLEYYLLHCKDNCTLIFEDKLKIYEIFNTGVVLIHIVKTLDRVWHEVLIYKLFLLNTPPQLILIIWNYLNGRTFSVRVNSSTSSRHNIEVGVPQGSFLSTWLFNLCINNTPKISHIFLALNADDTAIIYSNNQPHIVID